MQQAPRRRKKKRRFKPLRRLLLLIILFMMVYGLFSAGRWAYRLAFTPRIKYAAAQVVDQSFYKGRAVLVRDEYVITAAKGGVLNILIDGQSSVEAGQAIFEIVDQSLLSAIDKQLADEAQKLVGKSTQTDDAIQFKKDQLDNALQEVKRLTISYASVLNHNTSEHQRVYKDLLAAHKSADKIKQEYDVVARSQEQYEAKREELLAQRSQAITTINSPLSGVLSYKTDGLEVQLKPDALSAINLASLRQIKGTQKTLKNGDKLAAGQVVATVVNSSYINLLFEVKDAGVLPDSFEVVVAGEGLGVELVGQYPTSESGVSILALKLATPPVALLDARVSEVALRATGETLVSIPKNAVWEREGQDCVYVKAESGEHLLKEVALRQNSGKAVIVAGLNKGEVVVVNPKLIYEREAAR